jgi:hypothetical protein
MKRVWKEVYAFLITFGPALLAVLLDTVARRNRDEGKDGEGADPFSIYSHRGVQRVMAFSTRPSRSSTSM